MEQKKSPKVDLEKQRKIFFQIGLVTSLALILLAFECTRTSGEIKDLGRVKMDIFNEELSEITWREKKEKKIEKPKPEPILEIMDNDAVIEDDELDINTEVDESTAIDPVEFDEEEPVKQTIDFYKVENKPEFPGGRKALLTFIYENVVYPSVAIHNNIEGTVHLTFIVNENGFVENIQIERGIDPSLDRAAIEVVSKIPRWKPGKQRGKAVKVRYHVPIKFKLKY